MSVRRDLVGEQPLLAGVAAPDLDADAFLPVHPGAAAFFNGTQESFIDRYSNVIYLTPMVLGALASILAAAWRFLGVRADRTAGPLLQSLHSMPARIRQAPDEAALSTIEVEIDGLLGARLASAAGDEDQNCRSCHTDLGRRSPRQSDLSSSHDVGLGNDCRSGSRTGGAFRRRWRRKPGPGGGGLRRPA